MKEWFLSIDTLAETVFYTMRVYFPAAKVTKTRYTLTGVLLAALAGTAASVVLAGGMVWEGRILRGRAECSAF